METVFVSLVWIFFFSFKCVTENVYGCLKQNYSSRLNWIGPNVCLWNVSLQSMVYSDNYLSTVSICWNDEEREPNKAGLEELSKDIFAQ